MGSAAYNGIQQLTMSGGNLPYRKVIIVEQDCM